MIIAASPELHVGDNELPYIVDPELYYLTGYSEPEAIMVLNATAFTLFARPRDPARELWTGVRNLVRTISADTRVGRLLFSVELSNTVIVRKRAESTALFAALLFAHAGAQGALDNDHVKAASHFAVGGVGQTISAWLSGEVRLDHDELVETLAALIEQLAAMPPKP